MVTWYEGVSEALPLLVGSDPDVEVVRGQPGNSGPEASADYVVTNGTSLPAEHGLGSVRPV